MCERADHCCYWNFHPICFDGNWHDHVALNKTTDCWDCYTHIKATIFTDKPHVFAASILCKSGIDKHTKYLWENAFEPVEPFCVQFSLHHNDDVQACSIYRRLEFAVLCVQCTRVTTIAFYGHFFSRPSAQKQTVAGEQSIRKAIISQTILMDFICFTIDETLELE